MLIRKYIHFKLNKSFIDNYFSFIDWIFKNKYFPPVLQPLKLVDKKLILKHLD
jgi:hypothetical protein